MSSFFSSASGLLAFILLTLSVVGGVVTPEDGNRETIRRRWRSRPSRAKTSPSVSSSHSRPLYKLYLPFVVSENIIIMANETSSEASIEFRPNLHQLQNITRAFLNITTTQNLNSSVEEWTWTLAGTSSSPLSGNATMTTMTAASSSSSTESPIGAEFPSDTRSFNVFHYLRNLTTGVQIQPPRPSNGTTTIINAWMDRIRIVFKVRRLCSPQCCQPFLDTGLRLPFLKVDYTADVDPIGNADVEGLFSTIG